jgi:EAL domain-containing protein (putative c-di-GMP-specific phosphodiesterase class I)
MLREVCKNYKKWMEQGMTPIKVSVNYSSIQFFERNFVKNIIKIINEYQLDPHFLIMETTESVFIKNPEKAIVDIKRLQAEGIQVALDDFGTGFSSLSYLNSFNIDILKIDRSFIRDIPEDQDNAAIAKAIIAMAHGLNLEVIAEGVETAEQLRFLQNLGCDSVQGYLFSPALPVGQIETFVRKEQELFEKIGGLQRSNAGSYGTPVRSRKIKAVQRQ